MFPWYQGMVSNYTLPEDDRNGIQEMYGAKEKRRWGPLPNNYPELHPSTTRRPYRRPHTTTQRPTRNTYPYNHDPYGGRRHHDYNPRDRHPRPETTTAPPRRREHQTRPPARDPDRRTHYNPPFYNPRNPEYPAQTPRHYPVTTRVDYPYTTKPHVPYKPTARPEVPYRPVTTKSEVPYKTTKKPTYPPKPTTPTPSDKPNTCDTTYDAVALIRSEVFIFKNRWHWRIGADGLYPGYPIEITRMWRDLPKDLTHVDAVYERPGRDKSIVFFIGKQFYVFNESRLLYGYPRPLTHLDLPPDLPRVDAAMVWSHNSKTYLYSGSQYWKFDEALGVVEQDYPRDMSVWKGIGYNIDSAFQWKDGRTYFFKGKGFWKFNDVRMRVENTHQTASATFWMGCPGHRRPHADPQPTRSHLTAGGSQRVSNLTLVILTMVLVFRLTYL